MFPLAIIFIGGEGNTSLDYFRPLMIIFAVGDDISLGYFKPLIIIFTGEV